MLLKNKVSIVTGGSRGIGSSISKKLAEEGSTVILTYKDQKQKAEKVVKHILSKGGLAKAVRMNVSNRKSVKNVLKNCVKSYGGLDILVNNAGINKPTDFDKITDSDWDNIFKVNLKGPFICSQEAITIMKTKRFGSIINIGSVSGQYGGPRTAHYAASKAGLISLGQVIARYGARYNIRCNTIAAGLIESEMAKKGLKSIAVKNAFQNIPLGKLGSPKDIANMVVYLGSNKSSYITAQTINVNGGLYF